MEAKKIKKNFLDIAHIEVPAKDLEYIKEATVYSREGLANKIKNMNLSKKETIRLEKSIQMLQEKSILDLVKSKKIHRAAGSETIYVYPVDRTKRLMLSPLKEEREVGIILHDVIDIREKNKIFGIFERKRKNK